MQKDCFKINKEDFMKLHNWLIDKDTPELVYKDAVFDLLYDALMGDEEYMDMLENS